MTDQLFFIITAVLAGIVVGAFIMYFINNKGKNSAKNIAEVEEKLTSYQEDVVQHFEQTADLVDELTQSYKKVFDHLGKSARQLLTDEQVKAQIEKRKDNKVTLAFLTDDGSEVLKDETVEEQVEEVVEDVSDEIVEETKLDSDVEELVEEIETEMKKETTE